MGQAPAYDLILSNEDAKVMVRPLFPPSLRVVDKEGLRDHNPDRKVTYLALTRPAGAADRDPDSITRCFVACGSYLRKNGKVTLHSLSKVNAVFTCQDSDMKLALHGQPVTRATLRAATKPATLNLNGRQIDPAYDAQSRTVTVRSTIPK